MSGENPGFNPETKAGEVDMVFNYDHFYQGSEDFEDLRQQFPDFKGMCWLGSLVMADQALHPDKDMPMAINDVYTATYEITQGDFVKELIINVKESGHSELLTKDVAVELQITNPDTGGGLSTILVKFPEARDAINRIFSQKGLGIRLGYVPLLVTKNTREDFLTKVRDCLVADKVPLLTLDVADSNFKLIGGHACIVGGMKDGEIIVSDPNDEAPVKMTSKRFSNIAAGYVNYENIEEAWTSLSCEGAGFLIVERVGSE